MSHADTQSNQQALPDGLLVNTLCPHPFRHFLFRVPVFKIREHDFREVANGFVDTTYALILGQVYGTEGRAFFVQIQIIQTSNHQ